MGRTAAVNGRSAIIIFLRRIINSPDIFMRKSVVLTGKVKSLCIFVRLGGSYCRFHLGFKNQTNKKRNHAGNYDRNDNSKKFSAAGISGISASNVKGSPFSASSRNSSQVSR